MEDTFSQIFVLIACLFAGILGGVLYEPFWLIRRTLVERAIGILTDLIFFIVFAVIFVAVSVIFDFPAVRPYMLLGAMCGLLLYLVSLHRIVAFFIDKLYNVCKKFILRIKPHIWMRKRKLSGKTNERRGKS